MRKPSSIIQSFPLKNRKLFKILVVRDKDESVEVVESAVIDFNMIIHNLGEGHSVFIAPKNYGIFEDKKLTTDKAYINHV